MSSILPPTPQGVPPGHPFWNQWYEKLRVIINSIATSIGWVNLNFTGSKLQDIVDRQHNILQSIQGGAAGDYQHLTTSQKNTVNDINTMLSFTDGGPVVISPLLVSGSIQVLGGDTTTDGGSLFFNSGNSSVAGNGGAISFTSGTSAGSGYAGGNLSFSGGSGDGFGGSVNMTAGDASGNSGFGGDLQIKAGNCPWAGGIGGNLLLFPGIGETTSGKITLATQITGNAVEITDNGTNTLIGLYGATPVAQSTGWGSPSGTATKTTFNTATVTTAQLAERVKALIDYFKLLGLIS